MTLRPSRDRSGTFAAHLPKPAGEVRPGPGIAGVTGILLSQAEERPAARSEPAPGVSSPAGRDVDRPRTGRPAATRRLRAAVLRLALAALLIGAGGLRLVDLGGVADVVDTYRILPETLLLPSATFLAAGEVALGLWLLVGGKVAKAAIAAAIMHTAYLAWLGLALTRDLGLPASGGFAVLWPRPLTSWTVAQDALLLAAAFVLLHRLRRLGSPAGAAGETTRDG